MPDEATPSTAGSTEQTPEIEAPTDYREYVRWRQTGELPAKEETPPAAAAETAPAKTEPNSGADDTQQDEDEEAEAPRPGRGGSRQRKIDRLTRENEALRQQLQTQSQPKPVEAPAPAAKPPEPPGKPKLHDFATLEAYQEALTDWKLDQREAKHKADAAAQEARTAAEKTQAAWNSSEESARAAHADYDGVLQSVKAPEGPGVMAARQAMLEDEAGAEILYYLGTHPDEMQRIARLNPISAIREIGKLSAAVARTTPSSAGNGKPKAVSSAPKPPPPLRSSGQTTKPNILDENFARSDYKAWEKERVAQLKDR